jgi:hypothetical protein
MRKKKRAPMTDRARRGIVKKLEQFKVEGLDPIDALEISIRCAWTDVYEPKSERGKLDGRVEGNKESLRIALNRLQREDSDGDDNGEVGRDDLVPSGSGQPGLFGTDGDEVIKGES